MKEPPGDGTNRGQQQPSGLLGNVFRHLGSGSVLMAHEKRKALTHFHQLIAAPQKRIVHSDSLTVIFDLFLD